MIESGFITIPAVAIRYPAVYTPWAGIGSPRFSISADLNLPEWNWAEDEEVRDVLAYFERKRLVRFSTRYRPRVMVADYSDDASTNRAVDALTLELQRLDTQNMPRDYIFRRVRSVTVGFKVFTSNWGMGLSLERVGVDL